MQSENLLEIEIKNGMSESMDWSNVYNDYDSIIDFMSKNGKRRRNNNLRIPEITKNV